MTFVRAVLTLSIAPVSVGTARRNSATSSSGCGTRSPLITSTNSTSPDCDTRAMTWRTRPLCAASS